MLSSRMTKRDTRPDETPIPPTRERCFACYRPMSSCMCGEIRPIVTETRFIILMFPKEFRKIKNGTGHLTRLSLPNSELYVGEDFSRHRRVNELIDDPQTDCFILYPGQESIVLNDTPIARPGRKRVIFLIDATWPSSRRMLRLSKNLHALPRVSFRTERLSQFKIKQQPKDYCLSTIESTQCVLELLAKNGDERIAPEALERFLSPFEAMVRYQIERLKTEHNVRYFDHAGAFKAKRGKR